MSATTTVRSTTVPASLVEAHTLAGTLLSLLDRRGFVAENVTVNHHTFPWGDAASVSVQLDHPVDVAAFLGGLERVDYDVDGVQRYYFTGQWRGVDLHVSPSA